MEPTTVGLSTAIVSLLREYGSRKLPIDFLARALHISHLVVLREELKTLERKGAVVLDDDTVSLTGVATHQR